MSNIERAALKRLVEQWDQVKMQLDRLGLADARPSDGWQIFSLVEHPKEPGLIGVTIKPVTFNVTERAGDVNPRLYIVAQGRLHLDYAALKKDQIMKTVRFGTEVGYFRRTRNDFDHIYGAHYDFSLDEVGHPVFHAQMQSYNDRGHDVVQMFQLECKPTDHMKSVLRTVRLPTAQMDFFALLLQIGADHLMNERSSDEQKKAFADLRKASRGIQGAGYLWATLADAPTCMRALHWYK